jgi:hypothetical protein
MAPADRNPQAVLERLRKKKLVAQRVLATADGQEFLAILRNEFFSGPTTLRGATAEDMAFNLGRCDVLAYIEQLNKPMEEQ